MRIANFFGLVGILGAAACSDGKAVTAQPSGGGPVLGGVGTACTTDAECRKGLTCDMGAKKCAAGHNAKEGASCMISDECAMGLYCASGTCAKGGNGKQGDGCASDAQCGTGLKCGIVGFGLSCIPQGPGDVGAKCKSTADCLGGLACLTGTCTSAPPGVPPFGALWKGITCAKEDGAALEAYFRVPRGMDDGDFYRLPFPNDIRLKMGKPNLKDHPTPGADLLGFDIVDRYLRALETDNDGWGRYHQTFFRFSGQLDSATLKDNVQLVNLTTATPVNVLYYYYSIGGTAYMCPNWVTVGRAQGATFDEGATYAAILMTGLKGKGGGAVKRGADFDAMLAASAPSDMTLAAAYPAYAPLRGYLKAKSIDPATVLNAAVFTVGKPTATLAKLEKAIDGAAPPTAAMWTKCDAGVTSPCPDHDGDRACAAADPDFDELHALVSLPIFQKGKAPYLTPDDGGGISVDQTGVAKVERTEQVCLSLTVPKGAAPGAGWPTLVFAHGTGGNFRNHVTTGIAKDFAKGVDDGSGKVVKAAVLGIDQVQHGPRRGGSTSSPNELFFNFANPQAARGNVQQGAADQIALLRFAPTVAFDANSSPTKTAFKLSNVVGYWGHSQGATEGGLAVPFGNYGGAVFSGQGASLIDALLNKTSPVNIAAAVPFALQDPDGEGKLAGGAHHPVLSLLQTYIDGADPLNYGALVAATPPMGVNAHSVFQPYGQLDTYSPPVVEATYALAAELAIVAHDASVSKPDDIGGQSESPAPLSGNLTSGGKKVTAALRQYAPAMGKDGHFVSFDVMSARADTERFLAGVLNGVVPRVGQ